MKFGLSTVSTYKLYDDKKIIFCSRESMTRLMRIFFVFVKVFQDNKISQTFFFCGTTLEYFSFWTILFAGHHYQRRFLYNIEHVNIRFYYQLWVMYQKNLSISWRIEINDTYGLISFPIIYFFWMVNSIGIKSVAFSLLIFLWNLKFDHQTLYIQFKAC